MIRITPQQNHIISVSLNSLDHWLRNTFIAAIQKTILLVKHPNDITAFLDQISAAQSSIEKKENLIATPTKFVPDPLYEFQEIHAPIIKRAVMKTRQFVASEVDQKKTKTFNHEILATLEGELKAYDDLLQTPWMKRTSPAALPRLSDYIVQEGSIKEMIGSLAPRTYHHKFRTLLSAELFLQDLRQIREACDMRDNPVTVVYLDIDEFKQKFNTPYGHTTIDRNVLPVFTRAIEAHVFCHGFAYQEGGDEYMAILPNFPSEMATPFLETLRIKLGALTYREVSERTTVSIGYCCVKPDSILTNAEIQARANKAMLAAKASPGKNCIATFSDDDLSIDSIYIVSPIQAPPPVTASDNP